MLEAFIAPTASENDTHKGLKFLSGGRPFIIDSWGILKNHGGGPRLRNLKLKKNVSPRMMIIKKTKF